MLAVSVWRCHETVIMRRRAHRPQLTHQSRMERRPWAHHLDLHGFDALRFWWHRPHKHWISCRLCGFYSKTMHPSIQRSAFWSWQNWNPVLRKLRLNVERSWGSDTCLSDACLSYSRCEATVGNFFHASLNGHPLASIVKLPSHNQTQTRFSS